jgi:hypothetical protein
LRFLLNQTGKKKEHFCGLDIPFIIFGKKTSPSLMEDHYKNNQNERFSKSVRAGKRTYFFDVKATRDENLFITITESKRRPRPDGSFFYEKHKLFLYKEDLIKFSDGLQEALDFVRENNPTPVEEQVYTPHREGEQRDTDYPDVRFEDFE